MIGKGIAPNSSLHNTYLRIEPRAGVPTDVTARFQLNVLIDKVSGISMMKRGSRTFFPVMWFENKAGVPDELVFKMKLLSNLSKVCDKRTHHLTSRRYRRTINLSVLEMEEKAQMIYNLYEVPQNKIE